MHGAHAGRFFWRLRGGLGRRRIIVGRQRTRILLVGAEGTQSESCDSQESKQDALHCNRYVHNKYLKIPGVDGDCRNRGVAGKLFRRENRDFFVRRTALPSYTVEKTLGKSRAGP